MINFFNLKNKRFAVAFTDENIQVADDSILIEEPFPINSFSVREVALPDNAERFVRRLFHNTFPKHNRFFTDVEICVAINPLTSEIDLRGMRYIFKSLTSNIKTVPFPIATFMGLGLTLKRVVIVDIDEKYCYISLLGNGMVKEFTEIEVTDYKVIDTIKQMIKNCKSENIKDVWFVGTNERISDISNSLTSFNDIRVHIAENRTTATIKGLKTIIDNSNNKIS